MKGTLRNRGDAYAFLASLSEPQAHQNWKVTKPYKPRTIKCSSASLLGHGFNVRIPFPFKTDGSQKA